jgi:hypothetical protein
MGIFRVPTMNRNSKELERKWLRWNGSTERRQIVVFFSVTEHLDRFSYEIRLCSVQKRGEGHSFETAQLGTFLRIVWRRSLISTRAGLWLRSMAVGSNHVVSKDKMVYYNLD